MMLSWLRSRLLAEGRFLRHLELARWDKIVPASQREALSEFIWRAVATPGRTRFILRFACGDEGSGFLWADYRILSATLDEFQFALRSICIPEEGYESEVPDIFEDEPFFSVDSVRPRAGVFGRAA